VAPQQQQQQQYPQQQQQQQYQQQQQQLEQRPFQPNGLSSLAAALAAAQGTPAAAAPAAPAAAPAAAGGSGGAMLLAAAPAAAGTPQNQQGFVGGAPGMYSSPYQQHPQQQQQQQQQQPGSHGAMGVLTPQQQQHQQQQQSLLAPLQAPHQDLTARLAAAGTPAELLAVAGERGMGLFTEHLVLTLHRLGQLSSAGYQLDGGAPSGPQQTQLSDLVGLCSGRMGGMAPRQLAEVVVALALLQLAPAAPFLDTLTAECLNKLTGGGGGKSVRQHAGLCFSGMCALMGGGMGGGGEGACRGCTAQCHWLRLPVCQLHQGHASFNYTTSLSL
jgi:hypothetical protein